MTAPRKINYRLALTLEQRAAIRTWDDARRAIPKAKAKAQELGLTVQQLDAQVQRHRRKKLQ